MGRPQKQTADYFPHYTVHGKTLFIIEAQYGVAGYAAWFKLLELLCTTPGHCYYAVSEAEMQFMTAKMGFTDTETWLMYMETLIKLEAIDREIWQTARGVWCQHLVDNLAIMYSKRKDAFVPTKPCAQQPLLDNGNGNPVNDNGNPIKVADNPQSKVEETKVDKTKVGGKRMATTTLLGFEIEASWFDALQTEYPGLDIRFEEKRCFDWWTGQRKTIKNAKSAMRNWCINESKFKAEKANNPAAKRGKTLPDTKTLKEAWEK